MYSVESLLQGVCLVGRLILQLAYRPCSCMHPGSQTMASLQTAVEQGILARAVWKTMPEGG